MPGLSVARAQNTNKSSSVPQNRTNRHSRFVKLTSIPAEIGSLAALTTLQLHQNQLTSIRIPAEIGCLAGLTELYLDQNQLTIIPAEIVDLAALTTLTLHQNQLTSILSQDTLPSPFPIGSLSKYYYR